LLIGAVVIYDVHRSRLPELLDAELGADQPRRRQVSLSPLLWLVVALLCIALGFAVVALIAYLRLG
jgi:hypothetical protein